MRDRNHQLTADLGRGKTGPFLVRLQEAHQTITPSDPWMTALTSVKGRIGSDGVERISTEMVFEQLDVPPVNRTPELTKRLRGLMVQCGWTPVRARHVTGKGHAARVRGYARLACEEDRPL